MVILSKFHKQVGPNKLTLFPPALMHVKILAPEFGAAGYKDLDSSSSLYAEIPQEMI